MLFELFVRGVFWVFRFCFGCKDVGNRGGLFFDFVFRVLFWIVLVFEKFGFSGVFKDLVLFFEICFCFLFDCVCFGDFFLEFWFIFFKREWLNRF